MGDFDYKKFLKEERLKEHVSKNLEKLNSKYFDELIPSQGKCDTLEGEMLRAINRIIYRYYNDGDIFYRGYGIETAGPAESFLTGSSEIPQNLRSQFEQLLDPNQFTNEYEEGGKEYEHNIEEVLNIILTYIQSKEGNYTPNSEDMLDFDPNFEDDEEDEYEEDEYENPWYDQDEDEY